LATTVLLVEDDPFRAHVRRSLLERHFPDVERASDAAEAFILVEDKRFAERLGLVVVGLDRPGMESRDFVAELTSRLPSVPVLDLGWGGDDAGFPSGSRVRFLPRAVSAEQFVAVTRQMIEQHRARVA